MTTIFLIGISFKADNVNSNFFLSESIHALPEESNTFNQCAVIITVSGFNSLILLITKGDPYYQLRVG